MISTIAPEASDVMHTLLSADLVSYALIPIGVMLVSWVAQSSFGMRLNAGSELFAFGFALDLNLLLHQGTLSGRINPQFRDMYLSVFVVGLMASVLFLLFAAKTQSQIFRRGPRRYYPYIRVGVCWIVGIVLIAFHLFVLWGG